MRKWFFKEPWFEGSLKVMTSLVNTTGNDPLETLNVAIIETYKYQLL